MAPGACAKGFVCLAGAAGRVQVYVFDGHTSSLLAYAAGRSVRETEKANVTVVWDRRYGKQVRSALSRL